MILMNLRAPPEIQLPEVPLILTTCAILCKWGQIIFGLFSEKEIVLHGIIVAIIKKLPKRSEKFTFCPTFSVVLPVIAT